MYKVILKLFLRTGKVVFLKAIQYYLCTCALMTSIAKKVVSEVQFYFRENHMGLD